MASSKVEIPRRARALPIGTERRASKKTKGLVLIKVGDRGRRSEQWRPKHHVVWERANGRKVPPGLRVIFRDGDRQNFEPANLELDTPREIFARAMARFLALPPALRRVIRLNRQLERELRRQMHDCSVPVRRTAMAVHVGGSRRGSDAPGPQSRRRN